jgi:hypothetical protein
VINTDRIAQPAIQSMRTTLLYAMPLKSDITVESPLRRTILVVECQFASDASPNTAARLRKRLLADGYLDVPLDSFFMLVLPSSFHLWKPAAPPEGPPSFSASATAVLHSYLGKIAEQTPWPGAESMELAISAWLSDLAGSLRKPDASEADHMLVSAGLYDLIRGGTVRRELA